MATFEKKIVKENDLTIFTIITIDQYKMSDDNSENDIYQMNYVGILSS